MVEEYDDKKQAFSELTAAIERVLRVNAPDASILDKYIPTEYIVITSHAGYDAEERSGTTMVNVVFKDNDVPLHRAMGLVEWARTWMKSYQEE